MPNISQPHDKFFRVLMERPQAAAALLRERLPDEIVRLLSPEAPQLVEGTFIDRRLRASQSDRLFRARLRGGRAAFIYCLIEHKRAPERRLALQLLRYLTQVWLRLAREAPDGGLLPPVFPMVVYQGAERWNVPLDFLGLIDAEEAVKAHLLNFRYGLIELACTPDEKLSREPYLRAGFLILKYVALCANGSRDEREALAYILGLMLELERDFVEEAVAYIMNEFQLDRAAFEEAARRVMPTQEARMASIAAQYRAEGKAEGKAEALSIAAQYRAEGRAEGLAEGKAEGLAEGKAEGLAEGKAEGKAEALLKLLERRFRTVPKDRLRAIRAADLTDLELWFDRALDAASMNEVFARSSHPSHRSAVAPNRSTGA